MKSIAITVKEQMRSVDVALPTHVPLAELVPALCERLGWYGVDTELEFGGRLLPGERRVVGSDTLASLEVITGEVLALKIEVVSQVSAPVVAPVGATIIDVAPPDARTVLLDSPPGVTEIKGSFLRTTTGQTFPMQGRSTIIGRPDPPNRPPDVDLTALDVRQVTSRRHAQIWQVKDGVYWLRDLRSTNGLFVDGRRVRPGGRMRLQNGCEIQFGENGPVLLCYLDDA